jgi:hypothetical protein
MNTELYLEDFRLDLTTDISALLNFAIDDIKDFSARSTTWSRTIVMPGTSRNNHYFGHIFQIGQANEFNAASDNVGYNFNAAKSADCIIFQDQMQTFKGVLRLLQINIINGRMDYEVSISGKLTGLNVALSGGLLEDLDFSAYDHIYNDSNIVASWDNPGGSGVYYPLIDYGTYSTNKHDWDIKTFRPALYAREYIDKMFTAAGFRWNSDLIDSTRFKKLAVPSNKKVMTISLTDLFSAHSVATYYGTPPALPIFSNVGGTLVRFNTTIGSGFTPNAGPDKTVFTFNGLVTTNVTIDYSFNGTFTSGGGFDQLAVMLWKNGEASLTPVHENAITTSPFVLAPISTINISIAPGDTIEFRIGQGFASSISNLNFDTSDFNVTSAGGATVAVPIQIGDTVTLNENIPKNIRQIDFLLAIVKIFNLYVYEDRFDTNLIYLKPYIDYYSTDNQNSVDWTYKLNRNKALKIKPMSELNAKVYKFKFKSDSDYFNDLYRKRYSEGYGDKTYDSEFEFTEQEKSFEVVFSATPLIGYGGEEKVYSTIFKQTGNPPTVVEENTDSNIRILQTKKITGVALWDIKNGATVLNTLTRYGYAGHFNDPDAPTDDINFGATRELFFVLTTGNLSNNQFNVYWSGYMAEITNKDSRLFEGSFYLTPKDILELDFSKYIYLDGVLFRLNAIKNYNASKPADCEVELIKVNFTNYTEAGDGDSPPTGNYLLWADGETLDFNTGVGNELLYQ